MSTWTSNKDGASSGGDNEENRLATEARRAAGAVGDELSAAGQSLRQDAEALKQEAVHKAAEMGEEAKSYAARQKDVAADQMAGIASIIDRVADDLGNSEQASFAGYARDLAGGVRRLSSSVKNHDVDHLVGMAEDFGRRNPAAFLGAAALLGFAASRFAVSSAHRREEAGMNRQPAEGNGHYASRSYATSEQPPEGSVRSTSSYGGGTH